MTPKRNPIVSRLPGRIRLRDPLLRQAKPSARLAAALGALNGALTVDANPIAGSLLMYYDTTRCDRAQMEADVAALAAAELDAPAQPAPRSTTRPSRRNVARAANRAAKIGMLGVFPLTLALAASGNKALHATAGGVFTLLLLVHWTVHRRHLLK